MTDIPRTPLSFDPEKIKPQWFHPFLRHVPEAPVGLKKKELQAYAYDYFLRFLPLFREQPEGSLKPGVLIELSGRMKYKLGQAELFTQTIKLNQNYFMQDPRLLPYSLFHELVHLWLYDCHYDPGHTKRFYAKMAQFELTGLPVDPDVHIHRRLTSEAKFVYLCPRCENRWYVNQIEDVTMSCGFCHETFGAKEYPKAYKNPKNPTPDRDKGMLYQPIAKAPGL